MHKFNPLIHKRIFFIFLLGLICSIQTSFCQNASPLQQGKWIKIAVTQSQFYRLNQSWFAKHKIPMASPMSISIYGAKSGMLNPAAENQQGYLEPVAASYLGKEGKSWEILFWGDSPDAINQKKVWRQETNLYSDTAFYYVQIDAKKIEEIEEITPALGIGPALTFAYGLKHYEPETYNLLQSGRTWLGDAFFGNSSKILQYSLNDYFEGKPAYLEAKFYARSISASSFTLQGLGKSLNLNPISGARYDTKASHGILEMWLTPTLSAKNWNLPIQYQGNGGTGYIDYISLLYPRILDAKNTNPLYLLPNTIDSTIHLSIANLSSQQQIWINDGGKKWRKLTNNQAFLYRFQPNSRLAIADINQAAEPTFVGHVENQSSLTIPASAELIVISSPRLQKEAEKLTSYKTTKRGIQSFSLSTSTIYQDFSGGKQDVTAIRNFIRHQYQKTGSKLKYVILLGDASVDYKGQSIVTSPLEKACLVPTYQSKESLEPLSSYASDDYFGIVGKNAGDWSEEDKASNADIMVAIGRIPAKNPQEAKMFIHKLMNYESKQRTRLSQFAWVADDGDANIHMQDAEDFSKHLLEALIPIQQHKVYLDQYPMSQFNGIMTSPLATQAVLNLFQEKADFIHYTGHGSESGLADEKLLTTNDLVKIKNNQNLPILLTATCQFGRFDDPNILSGGEVSVLSDQGGAIALISTTRPVFQSSNYLFGQAFYRSLIANRKNLSFRLGDLFREAKNQSQSGVINRNIQLLGDPSLSLPWASEDLMLELDSLKQELKVTHENLNGRTLSIQLHRVTEPQKTLGTKEIAYSYTTMSPIIWKSSLVSKSKSQRIPLNTLPHLRQDNSYHLLVWSNQGSASIPLKNWKNKQLPEQIAPKITIDLVNEKVESSSASPTIKFSFADSSGLLWQNNRGEIAFIRIDDSVRFELAPIIQVKEGNTRLGTASLNLKNLKKGNHKIQVFCWDIYNNYAEQTLSFQVVSEEENLLAGRVYPNPLSRTFNFAFEQLNPWNTMPYQLEVVNLAGQTLIRRNGYSAYQGNNEGIITFDWSEDEWQKMNQTLIVKISLTDELKNQVKIFRIKTSTLK